MDEQATFETRAVLAEKRARRSRLALLVPVVALIGTAWAGLSGGGAGADAPDVAAVAQASLEAPFAVPTDEAEPLTAAYPVEVIGLQVQRLEEVANQPLGRDTPIAIAGWYLPTAITNCPRLAAIFRKGALPNVRGDADEWAFCDRNGVLYASRPDVDEQLPRNNLEDNRSKSAGLPAVGVSLVIGVVVPFELEAIGSGATPVVVIGRFANAGRELVVDHVAWTGILAS